MINKFYINFLFILIGLYGVLVILGKLYSPMGEFFPFFHWGLYVKTPQKIEKDYLDIYFEDSLIKKVSYYEFTNDKLSPVTSRMILNNFKNCIDKDCYEDSKRKVVKYLPKNCLAVMYTVNEFSVVDTLGVFKNLIFVKKD